MEKDDLPAPESKSAPEPIEPEEPKTITLEEMLTWPREKLKSIKRRNEKP